jgi:hypothetical protein
MTCLSDPEFWITRSHCPSATCRLTSCGLDPGNWLDRLEGRPESLPPATLHILLALASEDRHGYGIMGVVARQSGAQYRMGPGTLCDNLQKLMDGGLVKEAPRRSDTCCRQIQARRHEAISLQVFGLVASGCLPRAVRSRDAVDFRRSGRTRGDSPCSVRVHFIASAMGVAFRHLEDGIRGCRQQFIVIWLVAFSGIRTRGGPPP